jgi:perosamine synthetase
MTSLPAEGTYYFYRGRVALYALLRALNIQPGDEVLVPGFTCIAVPSPILGLRAKPVYVDIDPETYNIDPRELAKRITYRSRVIIAQHTFGIPSDMDAIMQIARDNGLVVIEDSCHVWGAKYRGMELGSIGVAAFYSYDPGKPFIIGMGGAAVVNSQELREEMDKLYRTFRNPEAMETAKLHAQYFAHLVTQHPRLFWRVRDMYRFLSRKGITVATWTSDSLEGTLGSDYQKRLAPSLKTRLNASVRTGEAVVCRHKRIASLYEDGLGEMGLSRLRKDFQSEPVLICYPLQVANKGRLLEEARRSHVEIGDWFRSPVHPLTERDWGVVGYRNGVCPVAERVANRTVTLPCHAGVTRREVRRTLAFLGKMLERGLLVEPAGSKELEGQPAGA